MKVSEIRSLIRNGKALLHETRVGRKTICFSLVEILSDGVLLLSYFASDTTQRSRGVGTMHLQHVLEQLQTHFPDAVALFFEIDDCSEPGLEPGEKELRERRAAFYTRLGAHALADHHFSPNLEDEEGRPLRFQLMWLPLTDEMIYPAMARQALYEILTISYGLSIHHPLVAGSFITVA
jgi:hypothetical protein